MKTLSAKDAKYGFGRLIDAARLEPVVIAKHGRPVVVVVAVEEYERLTGTSVVAVSKKTAAATTKDLTSPRKEQ